MDKGELNGTEAGWRAAKKRRRRRHRRRCGVLVRRAGAQTERGGAKQSALEVRRDKDKRIVEVGKRQSNTGEEKRTEGTVLGDIKGGAAGLVLFVSGAKENIRVEETQV
jgi:hypothetical protein